MDTPAATTVSATPPAEVRLEEVTVTTRRPYTTAGSEEIRARDFELRPKNRPADILRLVPGLVIAQHQGGGKAEQVFLRGFDADHGTDIALFVDDVPLNLRSHAHGQGYADEHWIIPETIEKIDVMKGPYDVSIGDFATAGSARFVTRRSFAESSVSAAGGMWNTQRYVGAVGRKLGGADALAAFEVYTTDGPFDTPERYDRWNGLLKATLPVGDEAEVSAWFSGYSADWTGSGQVPARAVGETIGRWGAIDPTEGGHTQRYNVDLALTADPTDRDHVRADAWYSRYTLQIFNDFTFFLRDPANGDEIEQDDRRDLFGGGASWAHLFDAGGREVKLTGGLDTRTDTPDVRLGTAVKRAPLSTTQRVHLDESSYGAYLSLEAQLAEKLRTVLGGRGDAYHYRVFDKGSSPAFTTSDGTVIDERAEGRKDDAVPGVTANLIFGPYEGKTEVYLNFGIGHHSNDARAVVRSADLTTLAKLYAYEIGARTKALDDRLDLGVGAFIYDLESELVLSGDEGGVSPSGRTRRVGLELEERLRLLDGLFLDADVSYTEASFSNSGDAVPLAPRLLARAGLTARAPCGVEGSLQMRHIGPRWAIEDRSAETRGYTVFDLFLKYRLPRASPDEPWSIWTALEGFVAIENLFDADVREAQFFFNSRLPGEPAGGVPDLHFTPGLPFTVTGGLTLRF